MHIVVGLGVRYICVHTTLVDVVGDLLVTISLHLSLVYLCNKLIIVVAIIFVYRSLF